jgi:uncharacterized protein (TIGR02271 family)
MANNIVSVYDNFKDAETAVNALRSGGFQIEHVSLNPENESYQARHTAFQRGVAEPAAHRGVGGYFRTLFGTPADDRHHDLYAEALRRGSFVVTVHADNEQQSARAAEILNRYTPVDIDERAVSWAHAGWTGHDRSAGIYSDAEIAQERSRLCTQGSLNLQSGQHVDASSPDKMAVPVIQEELQVGKREVQRGGVRIFQHVTETPVQETVHLREEHVSVERHPVDQPASAADMAALKEGSFEIREKSEEAVVGKTARVVEEVVVGKNVTERDQTISDTVRRSDVEVENLGFDTAPDDSTFRTHWSGLYGKGGARYEDYAPAYQYGARMAAEERYRSHRFSDIEPEIERDWASRNVGQPWEKFKDAVRYGWDRVTK